MNQLPDGSYTAVVDSIEDGLATVFFEQDGAEVGNQVLDVERLPDAGRHADAVCSVTIVDGEVTEWSYQPEATESRQNQAQSRFDQLSERLSSDDSETHGS